MLNENGRRRNSMPFDRLHEPKNQCLARRVETTEGKEKERIWHVPVKPYFSSDFKMAKKQDSKNKFI